jgi:hypothetical protein
MFRLAKSGVKVTRRKLNARPVIASTSIRGKPYFWIGERYFARTPKTALTIERRRQLRSVTFEEQYDRSRGIDRNRLLELLASSDCCTKKSRISFAKHLSSTPSRQHCKPNIAFRATAWSNAYGPLRDPRSKCAGGERIPRHFFVTKPCLNAPCGDHSAIDFNQTISGHSS